MMTLSRLPWRRLRPRLPRPRRLRRRLRPRRRPPPRVGTPRVVSSSTSPSLRRRTSTSRHPGGRIRLRDRTWQELQCVAWAYSDSEHISEIERNLKISKAVRVDGLALHWLACVTWFWVLWGSLPEPWKSKTEVGECSACVQTFDNSTSICGLRGSRASGSDRHADAEFSRNLLRPYFGACAVAVSLKAESNVLFHGARFTFTTAEGKYAQVGPVGNIITEEQRLLFASKARRSP